MSAEPTPSRPALGLPPRRTAAPAAEAPLARMLPGNRPETPKKAEPKEAETANMTVSIPAALRNRARAAYRATSYAEGDNTWSHFVAKAIEAETGRREAEHNDGAMYPSWGENLPGGRRLKDT
ncbi:ParB family protein [Arthrobacter sp. 92]|uniref:ParB family protein n=1 Tax=Arthrobacter sp. 92 TaxID=3418175 RepID=UPI003D049E91